MGSYKLSPNAETDMYRIWRYGMERWGLEAADKYIESLFERFEDIAHSPQMYPAVDDIRAGYRRSVFGRDTVYFRAVGGSVEIMAIIGQQDIENWV